MNSLKIAGSILGLTSLIVQAGSLISDIIAAPKALVRISERPRDLAPLLEQIADLIAIGEDLRGAHVILDRSRSLYAEILQMLKSVTSIKSVTLKGKSNFFVGMAWSLRRNNIEGLLEEMESLKLTLSCILQAHIVKIQNQSHRVLVDSISRVNQLEESVHILYNDI